MRMLLLLRFDCDLDLALTMIDLLGVLVLLRIAIITLFLCRIRELLKIPTKGLIVSLFLFWVF